MRIPIRGQICLILALTSLTALMVLGIALKIESYRYITRSFSSKLTTQAVLKAEQLTEVLGLYLDLSQSLGSSGSIQQALRNVNEGNGSHALVDQLFTDVDIALSGAGVRSLCLQSIIFPPNDATQSDINGIVNVTSDSATGRIELPYTHANGSPVFLGDPEDGYPPQLYPNLTYVSKGANAYQAQYGDRTLDKTSILFLGPLILNNTSSLISITVAVTNTSTENILGWITVVMDARLMETVVSVRLGLGSTAEVLLVGPTAAYNLFARDPRRLSADDDSNSDVKFVLPPSNNSAFRNRHDLQAYPYSNLSFKMSAYPAVLEAWTKRNDEINNAGSELSSHNEEGKSISVGYSQLGIDFVNWVLLVEQARSEVLEPEHQLRNIVVACIFGVMCAIVLVHLPIAHFAAKPIRELQNATEKSIAIYQVDGFSTEEEEGRSRLDEKTVDVDRRRFFSRRFPWKRGGGFQSKQDASSRQRMFRIPQKIPSRRHFVYDEITDLVGTFNEMSDELTVQYSKLEERVRLRTVELEQSRNIAQAASESKTLFVANISHELRTPLNGILGMCAIALHEKEIPRIKESLQIIYKSGDLLLHLLNDLLTFSRNSYGQQLAIEEDSFRLLDIGTQISAIFDKQARESQIDLKVLYIGVSYFKSNWFEDIDLLERTENRSLGANAPATGPGTTGLLQAMSLRGDKNRILQILMNLVSNSLKFTATGGAVEVRIRCLGYADPNAPGKPQGDTKELMRKNSLSLETSLERDPSLNQNLTQDLSNLAFEFEVEDTGPGIPEDMQEEIFKPFVQGDLTLSKKYGGTGLGLAICSQLANLMHGSLHLKSAIDVGSTFTLSLNLRHLKDRAPSISESFHRRESKPTNAKPESSIKPSQRDKSKPANLSRKDIPLSRSSTGFDRFPRVVGYPQPSTGRQEDPSSPSSARKLSLPVTSAIMSHRTDSSGLKRPSSPLSRTDEATFNSPQISSPLRNENDSSKVDGKPAETPPTPTSDSKILVAEDNKVNQEVIMRMLKLEKRTNILLVADGLEALNAVRTSPNSFSLILMDIQMPNMDGIQSTRAIRDLGSTIPIVALTAFADESNRTACMDAGMDAFLAKPVMRGKLRAALQEFLEKEREAELENGGEG